MREEHGEFSYVFVDQRLQTQDDNNRILGCATSERDCKGENPHFGGFGVTKLWCDKEHD